MVSRANVNLGDGGWGEEGRGLRLNERMEL